METKLRCPWCVGDAIYEAYHDNEWGKPQHKAEALFEKLCLESFQAGLSWKTILHRREGFREAFDGFNAEIIAQYDEAKIEELLQNERIIRHRKKIEAVINNAKAYLKLSEQVNFADWIWESVNHTPRVNHPKTVSEIPATTPESEALHAKLKAAGFVFLGPTTVYAFMQSCGLVNDHLLECHTRASDN